MCLTAPASYFMHNNYWVLNHKVTFDGYNKLILINDEVTSLDIQVDVYSAWKEWSLINDNIKWPPAIRSVGGDPITLSTNLGATFFLINGWRIKPWRGYYTIEVDGNLFTEEGDSPYIPADNPAGVQLIGNRSNLIDQLEIPAVETAAAIASEVWSKALTTALPGTYGGAINAMAASVIAADLDIDAGSTSTTIRTGAIQANGFYDGLICVIISSSGTVARSITSYIQTNGEFTLDSALPFTPAINDRFIVLGRVASAAASVDNNAVAIAVWARSITSPSAGSYGELINKVSKNTTLIPGLI